MNQTMLKGDLPLALSDSIRSVFVIQEKFNLIVQCCSRVKLQVDVFNPISPPMLYSSFPVSLQARKQSRQSPQMHMIYKTARPTTFLQLPYQQEEVVRTTRTVKGGCRLQVLSIIQVINHVDCYKFELKRCYPY